LDIEPKPVSVLFVLESEPENSCSLSFFNSYIESLIEHLSSEISVSLFYPVYSDSEEHYSLSIVPGKGYNRYITYLPQKFTTFKDTFASPMMENVLRYILKDESFDCVHIWSFKNHSFNYPFIAKERGIPVIVSLFDGFFSSSFIFEKNCVGCSFSDNKRKIRISNFVASPLSTFLEKTGNIFSSTSSKKKDFWFEFIGRYTSFYNSSPSSPVEQSIVSKRNQLALEVIEFTDKFILNSETEYNSFYRSSISENKIEVINQGGAGESVIESKPFEIEGAVKFGFMGELLPEEGINEILEAFNTLYNDGYQNELHIYGETVRNIAYFNKIRKNLKNSKVILKGPIEPGRLNSALGTFDVLIVASKWSRSDCFLLKTAISSRKAVIVPSKTYMSEIVKKYNRGLILEEISSASILNAVSELERNRKRLYYFMRVNDDFNVDTVKDNADRLFNLYCSINRKKQNSNEMILKRKLLRKKIDRSRG
jgi:glycosyltransferase involved in cell wall biosynthesis